MDGRQRSGYSAFAGKEWPGIRVHSMTKPFIYIAALRRTGSTMLCEALTQLPHSIVFNEPNLGARRFAVRNTEAELLASVGIDLPNFVKTWSFARRRFLIHGFRRRFVPMLMRKVSQVGIKEIFHDNWRRVVGEFPDTRIVLTARDPRDIYLSLRSRYVKGHAIWSGEFTPLRVADNLMRDFAHQLEMSRDCAVMHVRYEDLCLAPEMVTDVLRFVDSDITEVGGLGEYLRADARRVAEGALHDGRITDRRVARWRQESGELRDEAQQVFHAMADYVSYWRYGEEGVLEFDKRVLQNGARSGRSARLGKRTA